MTGNPFSIVNVFAERKYAGNHLVVVRSAETLSDARMQDIAREIGPAAFILSDDAGRDGYRLRVFTPAREILYCGHPVLGAAHVIQTELLSGPREQIGIVMPSGPLSIGLSHDGGELRSLRMRQDAAVFGREHGRDALLACLRDITAADLDADQPIQEVSTGLAYVVVPLRSLAALKRLSLDEAAFSHLSQGSATKLILLFAPETHSPENDIHLRVFAHHYGIPEDPGTGSAAGALGAYLLEHDYFGRDPLRLRVEQGHAIARPSLLELEAERGPNGIEVMVGGRVITLARGELL